jgi:glutamate-5-semialdehyde dehydrogenase
MESTQYWKKAALQASRSLNLIDTKLIDQVLSALADAAEANATQILAANAKDLAAMDKTNPMYDRLLLTEERIAGIAADIRNVASLPSPLGRKLMETTRPNGMTIEKVSVPFGVVGVIYEARPNVSFDVFSLCLKSGNALC